ncbi:MAG: iron-sulfur cluster insertion protein ErpA [bacterium]|nr:iron-sulfur cluster insertion protein ErpA [bacterium]MDE0234973.1 iron-sulfur cluster insertion protein ErpA [bacterium]
MQLLTIKSSAPQRPILLTDSAVAKVKTLLSSEEDDDLGLRVAVRPGGCSGFSYEMFFDSDVEEEDIVIDFDGLRVLVDPQSAKRITGATLDYREGLMEAGFSIDNPNVTRSCGCGNSFA